MTNGSNPPRDTKLGEKIDLDETIDIEKGDRQAHLPAINGWLTNKKLIEAVADEFNVNTMFVFQPISAYKYDRNYLPFIDPRNEHRMFRSSYPVMNELLPTLDMGKEFLWLGDIQAN